MFIKLHQLEGPDRYSDNIVFTEIIIVNKSQICFIRKNKIDISDSAKEQILSLKDSLQLDIKDLEASVIYFSNGHRVIVAESTKYINNRL